MATWIFHERPKSGDFTADPDTYTLKYVCGPSGDELFVKAYALQATPLIYNFLWRQTISAKYVGGGLWHLDVPYGKLPPPNLNTYKIRYDTTGGTAHVTQAKEHLDDYVVAGADPCNSYGVINAQADGRVEGVDIVVPAFRWTEEHTFPVSLAGWPYSQVLEALTGKVNNASFRGFGTGQVLFEGATGGYSSAAVAADKIELTYHFAKNTNITNVTYDDVQPVTKVGWEYLSFEHEQIDDGSATGLRPKLKAIHRDRLYDAVDFWLMQLPGT